MPLTARQLYDAAQLEPADFGSAVDPDANEATQLLQALAYLDSEDPGKSSILKSSFAEVSLPVRKALGNYTAELSNAGLATVFGVVAGEVLALWDAAQTSFGRSELNKRVDSNSKSYDQDSDQDRIQGNQRLQKLLDFITEWKVAQNVGTGGNGSGSRSSEIPVSMSVPVVASW